MKQKLICICGPTASGKTALSVALAKKLNTSIISADSMQIYRGMDIGTAKPTAEEQAGIPHEMLNLCDPQETFSVARYVELADACAQRILSEGHLPIVIGGTGLYMNALIEGSAFSGDETDLTVRQKYEEMAREQGNLAVHDCLRAVDPTAAEALHPNNLKRVIRALEVFEQTGMTLGELNAKNKRAEPKYDALMIGVCPLQRDVLYDRINHRVDLMLAHGLLEEAKAVRAMPHLSRTAAQAIGYKELFAFLDGQESLEACTELLKQKSRNYAKRQMTWLKKDDRIHWIYYNKTEGLTEICQKATDFLRQHGVQ